jgi:hypothetical protein
MLILAEGTVHRPVEGQERTAAEAWLGPMVDEGFLQAGYVDASGERVWMVISATDRAAAQRRLADLPVVREGLVSFRTTHITALRFT